MVPAVDRIFLKGLASLKTSCCPSVLKPAQDCLTVITIWLWRSNVLDLSPAVCNPGLGELRLARRGTWNLGFFLAVATWGSCEQLSGALAEGLELWKTLDSGAFVAVMSQPWRLPEVRVGRAWSSGLDPFSEMCGSSAKSQVCGRERVVLGTLPCFHGVLELVG